MTRHFRNLLLRIFELGIQLIRDKCSIGCHQDVWVSLQRVGLLAEKPFHSKHRANYSLTPPKRVRLDPPWLDKCAGTAFSEGSCKIRGEVLEDLAPWATEACVAWVCGRHTRAERPKKG
jgi:hypothetical protein